MMDKFIQQMMGGFSPARSIASTNVFEVIMSRLVETIDKHVFFQRVDDVMNKKDPIGEMGNMMKAQIKAAHGAKEEWEGGEEDTVAEEAFEDKGRMHITMADSLKPILTLFTTFNYVRAADAAKKDAIGMWNIIIHIRDKRISDKYDTTLKNFCGNVFNEEAFSKMLAELSMILRYIIETDGLEKPIVSEDDKINLNQFTVSNQIALKQAANELYDHQNRVG